MKGIGGSTPETTSSRAKDSVFMESIMERLSHLENLYFPRAQQSSALLPSQRKSILQDLYSRDIPVFLGTMADQLHIDDPPSDDEHHLPSSRSELPLDSQSRSVNARNADDQLLLQTAFKDIQPNNHVLDFEHMRTDFPVIHEILKEHPLAYALSETANVPELYVQQFWHTLTYVPPTEDQGYDKFEGYVDQFKVVLTRRRVRRVLCFPSHDSRQDFDQYEDELSEADVCAGVRELGYSAPLPNAAQFKRKHLVPLWYNLFSILNRCLTSKTKGIDQCSSPFLKFFHAVAYDRHVDYVTPIWTELQDLVRDKATRRNRRFLPFMRFLAIFVRAAMRSNPQIPRRSNHRVLPDIKMSYLLPKAEPEGINTLRIPQSLLNYADARAVSVRGYRERHRLLVPLRPGDPPQRRILLCGEGPSNIGESVPEVGTSGQGEQRENLERETGGETTRASPSHTHSTARESDSESIESDHSPDPDLDLIPIHSNQPQTPPHTTISHDGEIRRTEGVVVEDEPAGSTEKERREENIMSVNVSPSTPYSREATSSADVHVLPPRIEKAAVIPTAQVHTQPDHSTTSRKVVVSDIHGESPHTLPTSHSESVGIEVSQTQPRSTPFFQSTSSLGPIHFRTPMFTFASSLSGGAGTTVVASSVGVSRGSVGNPASANTMPTLSAGHTVHSISVPTVSLSGTGVIRPSIPLVLPYIPPPSTLITNDVLNLASKSLESSLKNHSRDISISQRTLRDELRQTKEAQEIANENLRNVVLRFAKGKHIEISSELTAPTPPPATPQVSVLTQSLPELKSVLFASMLAQREYLEPADADLLEALRTDINERHRSEQATTTFQNSVLQELKEINRHMSSNVAELKALKERMTDLETTCKAQAGSSKRKHDDRDDPDPHEGENQEKRKRVDQSVQSVPTTTTSVPDQDQGKGQTSAVQESEIQVVYISEPEPQFADLPFMLEDQPIADPKSAFMEIINIDSDPEPDTANLILLAMSI